MSITQSGNPVDMAALRARAGDGDREAMLALFNALDAANRNEESFSWLVRLARAGHLPSSLMLGERMVIGFKAPQRPVDGAQWIAAAGQAGLPQALHGHAILAALGIGRPQSWSDAWSLLQAAARAGHAMAASQLQLFELLGIRGERDIAQFLAPAAMETRLASPQIALADGVLPEAMCHWLIERARPKLYRAPVFAPRGGSSTDKIRTNSAAGFGMFETDLVFQLARARVAATVGSPIRNQEPPQVLHYAEGEQYTPHWDYFDPSVAAYRQHIEWGGQRICTALVYLNAGFEGGETGFPRLDAKLKANAGGLLTFRNVTPDGAVDPRTLHEGCATTRGEKWLLSVWIRDREHVPA